MSGKTYVFMILTIGLLFGLYVLMGNVIDDTYMGDPMSSEEQKALNELYESGKYEDLVVLANKYNSDKIVLWDYEHYDFLNYYSQYVSLRDDFIPKLDKGELTKVGARRITGIVFSFYYRCYDHTLGTAQNASEKDIEVLDNIRNDYILEILHDRMGYTDNDMQAAQKEIMENNYFHIDKSDKYSDSYCERYK